MLNDVIIKVMHQNTYTKIKLWYTFVIFGRCFLSLRANFKLTSQKHHPDRFWAGMFCNLTILRSAQINIQPRLSGKMIYEITIESCFIKLFVLKQIYFSSIRQFKDYLVSLPVLNLIFQGFNLYLSISTVSATFLFQVRNLNLKICR